MYVCKFLAWMGHVGVRKVRQCVGGHLQVKRVVVLHKAVQWLGGMHFCGMHVVGAAAGGGMAQGSCSAETEPDLNQVRTDEKVSGFVCVEVRDSGGACGV